MKKVFSIIALSAMTLSLNAMNLDQPTECEHYAMEQAAAEYDAGLFDDEWDSLDSYLYHLDICESSGGNAEPVVIIGN